MLQVEEEIIKKRAAYVQECQEVEGKFEVLCQMWSNWAGNYWQTFGLFDTEEEADGYKKTLVLEP